MINHAFYAQLYKRLIKWADDLNPKNILNSFVNSKVDIIFQPNNVLLDFDAYHSFQIKQKTCHLYKTKHKHYCCTILFNYIAFPAKIPWTAMLLSQVSISSSQYYKIYVYALHGRRIHIAKSTTYIFISTSWDVVYMFSMEKNRYSRITTLWTVKKINLSAPKFLGEDLLDGWSGRPSSVHDLSSTART